MKFKEGDIIIDRKGRFRLKISKVSGLHYDLTIVHRGNLELDEGYTLSNRHHGVWDKDCEIDEDYMVEQILTKYSNQR